MFKWPQTGTVLQYAQLHITPMQPVQFGEYPTRGIGGRRERQALRYKNGHKSA